MILSPPHSGLSCFVLLVVTSTVAFFPTIAPLFFFFLSITVSVFFLYLIVLDFCEFDDVVQKHGSHKYAKADVTHTLQARSIVSLRSECHLKIVSVLQPVGTTA